MTDFDHDLTPLTQPAGALDPPRRRPPTAVGTVAPEPQPSHESSPEFLMPRAYATSCQGAPIVRRVARQVLALLLATAALGCAWPLGWRGRLAFALLALAAQLFRLGEWFREVPARTASVALDDRAA